MSNSSIQKTDFPLNRLGGLRMDDLRHKKVLLTYPVSNAFFALNFYEFNIRQPKLGWYI